MRSNIGFAFCIAGVLAFASVVRSENAHGTPGVDYPNYHSIPKTSFSCSEQKYIPGFYADLETKCQAFHFCFQDRQESFLCPTGTIFNQAVLTCDVWYNSNCSLAPSLYDVNIGPVMENAGKNLPMLLKLRKRSQEKLDVPTSTANIYEKFTSLYDTSTENAAQSEVKTSSTSQNMEHLSNILDDISKDSLQDSETNVRIKPQFPENILSALERNLQDLGDETHTADSEDSESVIEDADTDIVYDPVTDGYYKTYYQHETENSEPARDDFGRFYDYGNLADFRRNEHTRGSLLYFGSGNRKSGISTESLGNIDRDLFAKRGLLADQSSKHSRRRQAYVVVTDDEPNVPPPNRQLGSLLYNDGPEYSDMAMANDEPVTEASDTTEASEVNATDHTEQPSEPFPRPTRIPYHLRDTHTEEPMTSSQFGAAIFEELVLPGLTEEQLDNQELFPILGSNYEPVTNRETTQQEQLVNAESREDLSFQRDQPAYIDQIIVQDDLESDSSAYGFEEGFVVEDPEVEIEIGRYAKSDIPSYRTEDEMSIEDANDFVVIPDEMESRGDTMDSNLFGVRDKTEDGYSSYGDVIGNEQMDEGSQSVTGYTFDDGYRYYYSRYKYPAVQPMGFPHLREVPHLKVPRSRRQYHLYTGTDQKLPLPNKGSPSPIQYEASPTVEDVDFNYTPEMARLSWQHFLSNARTRESQSEAGDQTMSYIPDAENPYVYEEMYRNPYVGGWRVSYEYDAENQKEYAFDESTGIWLPDINGNAEVAGTSEVSGDNFPLDVAETYLDETNPLNEQMDEYEENLMSDESDAQDEDAYYVFDFDEERSSEDGYSNLVESAEHFQSDFQKSSNSDSDYKKAPEMEQRGISAGNDSLVTAAVRKSSGLIKTENDAAAPSSSIFTSQNGNVKLPSSAKHGSTLNTKSHIGSQSSQIAENSIVDEKPVTLSAFERIAALKAAQEPQGSSLENLDLSGESRFLSSMAFPESMDFGPYGIGANMGQQYGMLNSMKSRKTGDLYSHPEEETEQLNLSKLSAIQERLRSMKQGKFGVFKKYMSSTKDRKD